MTMIVQKGTMKVGSLILIGEETTKIKHMHDDMGKVLEVAKPGDAVQVIGIPSIPVAGEIVNEI
jgi:translation initiation factor IF-2